MFSVKSFIDHFLPFNLSNGDQRLNPVDDGSSALLRKDAVSNLTCPFFGTPQSSIAVSIPHSSLKLFMGMKFTNINWKKDLRTNYY